MKLKNDFIKRGHNPLLSDWGHGEPLLNKWSITRTDRKIKNIF